MDQNEKNKYKILTIAIFTAFQTPFMISSINIALPSIGTEFSAGTVTLSWVGAIFLLLSSILMVPFGKLADIYGRKKFFVSGMVLFTVSSLMAVASPSVGILIALRALQGVASSMILVTSVAILTTAFPPNERGFALGTAVASTYVGLSLGPFLGGYMTGHLGWRSIFFVNVPLSLIVIVMASIYMSPMRHGPRIPFDVFGSVTYSISLCVLMYGLSTLPSTISAYMAAAGALGLAAFLLRQARIANPVFDVTVFVKNRVFLFSSLACLIHYSATYSITFLLSLYLQYVKGKSPQEAGLILIAQPVMMAIFSPLAGRLSDRFEPRVLASVGMAVTAAGIFQLSTLDAGSGITRIVWYLIFIGFGYALFSSPNTNAAMGAVDRSHYGVASAAIGTMRSSGQMLSMGLTAMALSIYTGGVRMTPSAVPGFLASMSAVFVASFFLCFAAIFMSLARGRVRAPGHQ